MIRTFATVVTVLCALGAAGCRSPNAENYPCSLKGECPSGFTCGGDNRCHRRADAGQPDACEGGNCRTDGPDGGDAPKDTTGDTGDAMGDTGGDTSGDTSTTCMTDSPCTPANRCFLGRTRCSVGGVASCEATSMPQSAGTPCGDGMVCSPTGTCIACAVDTDCERPGQPCKLGKIACATGSPVCAEAGNVAAGTACGTNLVCANGECVTCTNGAACQPANPCRVGMQSCAGGTPTCTETTTAVTDGQACGTDRVCRSGMCVDCAAGQACAVSGQPCRSGITSCNTGTAVCIDSGNKPNGTTCGAGMVCGNGSCVACAAGTACTPTNPCHKGTLTCGGGTPTCTDTAMNVDNGLTCGTDKVCSNGTCVDCTAGRDCVPAGTTCKVGVTSCATGASICQMTGNAANGSTCGTNMVCNAGSCITCAAGMTCTPSAPCHNGSLACTGGSPTCTDLGTNLTNGTSCGNNLVCNNGSCIACTAGQVCNPGGNVCQVGQTSCTTGSQTCLLTGNVTNGTTCGTNRVCNGGQCVTCTEGTTCVPSTGICHVGSQSCATGTPVCNDTGTLVANGMACGTNLVCNGGACVACTAGMTCTPANPCHVGTTACGTGTMTCTDTGANAANGTMCGANLACAAGTCTCTQGTACTPSNPCQTGATSCSTGTSVCNPTGTAPNGTTCAPGKMCMSGTCVLNPGCPGDNSPVLDCPCATNGTPACNGAHQAVRLRCTGGVWVDNGMCTSGNNCDQSDGQCKPIINQCRTMASFCSDANTQQNCNADWTATTAVPCAGVCSSNMCQAARCGDGKVQSGAPLNEECDDANSTADDGCENNCRRSTVIGLAAGAGHSCALLGSGNVRCWGDNVLGQLGIGNDMFRGTTPPYMIPSISLGAVATAIAAGADHTCALLTGGTVRCWGKNNHGQHGQGDATIRLSPSAALAFASPATKISAGGDTTCVVLQSGAVHCWGGNTSGMLGKATTTDICASAGATCLSAVAIGGTASAISVGSNAVCAVLSSGSVICWGGNGFGELGRGDTTVVGDTETPAAAPAPATPVLPAGRTATLIASGSGHNCARLDNGQMECWGLNTAGQLGLGLSSATFAIGDNESPSTAGVTQLMTVSALFASNTSSCAKLVAGGIRCWGNNNKGHLGYPDTANKGGDTATIPSNLANVNFGSGITATTMALGSSHACALLSNGQVRCWGRNNVGQLGNAMTLSGAMDFVGGANMTPDTLPAVQVFPP